MLCCDVQFSCLTKKRAKKKKRLSCFPIVKMFQCGWKFIENDLKALVVLACKQRFTTVWCGHSLSFSLKSSTIVVICSECAADVTSLTIVSCAS